MVGEEIFQNYVQRFNFDQPTGVDLVGEIGGNINNLFTGREINLATISFGQGITMTPLGLVAAIGALANDGKLMRPYVVEKIIYSDGEETDIQPELIDRVITPETSEEISEMLVSVVENGYGKPARLTGYDIAGKTGTAQMADMEQGGYSEETIHSFVGYAPAYAPEISTVVLIEHGQSSTKAARLVRKIVDFYFTNISPYQLQRIEIS